MNRRSFLAGLLASAAAAPIIGGLPAIGASRALTVYGRSPASIMPAEWRYLVYAADVETTYIYGNPEWSPTQFTGFVPSYNIETDDHSFGDDAIRAYELSADAA